MPHRKKREEKCDTNFAFFALSASIFNHRDAKFAEERKGRKALLRQ